MRRDKRDEDNENNACVFYFEIINIYFKIILEIFL